MTQLPDTMQAVALTGHGDLDMLQYGDYPVPDVNADEVLLEVHACGMNNTETNSLADVDYIGHGRDGGYAEYCAVPAVNAHRVNSSMTDAELATFCCAYMTGEHMLDRARVAAGERVLISGAAGGVGGGANIELDIRTVYLKQLEIHDSSQGTRKAFAQLLNYIESAKIKPSLFATYPLSEFHREQTDFMAKGYIGKLVVMPDRFFQPV